jgi:hypothetical protein
MFTDPHLHLSYVTTEHDRLVRTVQRDRLLDQRHAETSPHPQPLTTLRASLGGSLIALGQRLQGAAALT